MSTGALFIVAALIAITGFSFYKHLRENRKKSLLSDRRH